MKTVAVILGSAFQGTIPGGGPLEALQVETPWGAQTLHRAGGSGRPAYVSFRHGHPYRLLPHQIPYRALAWALRAVGCGALLTTSSVGVLDAQIPLFRPLLLADLMMLDNRLPDGTACTMFERPSPEQGHLVLNEGLFSRALTRQVASLAEAAGAPVAADVVFAYAGGPRTKTAAENRMWALLGAHVNSMTLAPEVVLANELEIPCAGLVVGHKYSVPGIENPEAQAVADSLTASREAMARIVTAFLQRGEAVPFANHLFRMNSGEQATHREDDIIHR